MAAQNLMRVTRNSVHQPSESIVVMRSVNLILLLILLGLMPNFIELCSFAMKLITLLLSGGTVFHINLHAEDCLCQSFTAYCKFNSATS